MAKWVKVAKKSELRPGSMKAVKVGGQRILLAQVGKDYHAIGDICTHEQCHLSEGTLEGVTVTCPCHSAQFDVASGKNSRGDHFEPAGSIADEPAFPVKVEDGAIWVEV